MNGVIVSLVSVNNKRFTAQLFGEYSRWAAAARADFIGVVLDRPERHNLLVFENLCPLDAEVEAIRRGKEIGARLSGSGARVLAWDEFCHRVDYDRFHQVVYDTFHANGPFRRRCLNQAFSTLQPRFRQLGVSKKTDPFVGVAVNYLLEEIALKVAIWTNSLYLGEIMPKPEANLILDVYREKYFQCFRKEGLEFLIVTHDGALITTARITPGVASPTGFEPVLPP